MDAFAVLQMTTTTKSCEISITIALYDDCTHHPISIISRLSSISYSLTNLLLYQPLSLLVNAS